MENLPFVILLNIVFLAICLMFFYIKKLKLKFLQKIISKRFINKYIYSSLIINDICRYMLKQNRCNYQKMLNCLIKNNLNEFYKLVINKDIKSKIDICNGKISKQPAKDIVYLLALAKFYIKRNKQDKASEILQSLFHEKMTLGQKACFRCLMAQISVYEGDLFVATEDLNISLNIFKKKKMLFEEAEAYFILGTIYRVSGIYDTAEFMLRTSVDLYNNLSSTKGEAEVLGTLGLLMSAQNRFEEAHDYFQKALTKTERDKTLKAFILSQVAMLELIEGHNKKAFNIASSALKQSNNDVATANLYDVLSRVALADKKYKSSVEKASLAFDLFFKNKNYSAAFESLYTKAIALFKAEKFQESEKNLRYLLDIERKYKNCFHVAGAYTLLGLVLLENNCPDRAKAMFNQALSKEICNNRKIGMAIDYANLAIVEKLQGNNEEADKNLQKALSQTKDLDEDIIEKIKKVLN